MKNINSSLPERTLEVLVRSFFRDTSDYGFSQLDYVRFVNMLLDLSMESSAEINGKQSEEMQVEFDNNKEPDCNLMVFPIESESICIRKFDPHSDMEVMKEWLKDKSGRQFLLSRMTAQTIDIERIIYDEWNVFGIITTLDDVPIGCMAYLGYNAEQKKAELRKLIGVPSMRGKGCAKEATQLWIRYGIKTLKLKKIYLSTLHMDLRNIQLNESLGFKVEGVLRNEICVDGVYHDVLRMGLWNDE